MDEVRRVRRAGVRAAVVVDEARPGAVPRPRAVVPRGEAGPVAARVEVDRELLAAVEGRVGLRPRRERRGVLGPVGRRGRLVVRGVAPRGAARAVGDDGRRERAERDEERGLGDERDLPVLPVEVLLELLDLRVAVPGVRGAGRRGRDVRRDGDGVEPLARGREVDAVVLDERAVRRLGVAPGRRVVVADLDLPSAEVTMFQSPNPSPSRNPSQNQTFSNIVAAAGRRSRRGWSRGR